MNLDPHHQNVNGQVRWVASVDDIPEALWADCFPPPLEGRWWYAALERAGLEDQFEFLYGILETAGRAVGIVPAFVMRLPLDVVAPKPIDRLLPYIPPLRYQKTLFVGSPCADEGTVGLAPGITLQEAAPVIQNALETLAQEKKTVMIVWKDFPENAWPALNPLARSRGLFRVTSYPNTRLDIAGCTCFEDYLGRLSQNNRTGLRKKLKKSHAMGPLEVTIKQRPTPAELDEIFALFWQTYTRGTTKFERLTPKFFENIAQAEPVWFVLLRDPQAGNLVSFNLCFHVGRRLICKYFGRDYHYGGDWYLYFRQWEAVVKWATTLGVSEIQSGQTVYAPKFDQGFDPVPMDNYCRHRNRLVNRLLAAVARHVSWATLDDALAQYVKAHGEPGHVAPNTRPAELHSTREAA